MEEKTQLAEGLAGGVRKGRGPLWVLLVAFVVGVGALMRLILGWHDRTTELVGRVVWEESGVRPKVIRRGVESLVPEAFGPRGGEERRRAGVRVGSATIYLSDHRVVVKVGATGSEPEVDALLAAIRRRAGVSRVVEVSRESE